MRTTKRNAALACLGAITALSLAACSSSKTNSTSTNQNSNANAGTNTTLDPSTLPTIPAPAPVTGTLSGPGVTPTTITIGQITTVSGPVPGLFQGANDGLDAWADWVNANGGIAGRQIKIVHVDDAFNCTTYTNAMQSFVTSAFAVVGNLTLEDTCGKKVLQANPHLLDIQALELDPTLYSIPNVYSPAPNPPGAITTGLAFMKQRFPNAITHAAELNGQAASANGKEERLVAESLGYKYVYTQDIPDLTTDFTNYILRMKNDNVQFVDMTALAVTSDANFLKQAAQQNFHPQVLYGASAYDAQLFPLLGNASLANNVVWSSIPDAMYLGQDQKTVPAVNTFLEYMGKVRNGAATPNLFAVEAWSAGQLLLKAMQGAGPDVNPTSVAQAIGSITSFNADGLIGTANPAAKMGTPCVVVANVQEGGWVRVDPTTPGQFDCSGSYHPIPLSQITGG